MRRFHLTFTAVALLALCGPLAADAQAPQRSDDEPVRLTVAEFWRSLGDLDADGLQKTLDWPNVLVETKPDSPTHPVKVNTNAAVLEAEVQRTVDGLAGKRKGDFFGTTVSSVEVRILHSTLAYAHHVCQLGGDAGKSAMSRRGSRDFEAIAVLRATGNSAEPWKIILITIPQ